MSCSRLLPRSLRPARLLTLEYRPQVLSAHVNLYLFSGHQLGCRPNYWRAFSTRLPLFKEGLVSSKSASQASEREQQPAYEMTFTCTQCNTRSTHKISKQGYHHGTVLVQCPGCKNRHLMADHLKIFSDKRITLEDILKEKGQLLKTGTVSGDGDVEFWDDGTQTPRLSSKVDK